jgi:hypothetical protein
LLARDTGNVGIGTATPAAKLSVNGGIQLGDDLSACGITNDGTLRWHMGVLQACGSNAWTNVGGVFTGSYATVTGSRAFGTTYTNANPGPLFVTVTGFSASLLNNKSIYAYVGGTLIQTTQVTDANDGMGWLSSPTSLSFIVPPGKTYLVTQNAGAKLSSWTELH